jgi:hypothetical protein
VSSEVHQGQSFPYEDDTPEVRHGWRGSLRIVGSAVLALIFLLLIVRLPLSTSPSDPEDTAFLETPRQRVVIFLVDSSDYFDAHGAYVQSVIRQYCRRCDVRQVNVHGDLSLPSLVRALQYVRRTVRTGDATTTTLVNLSLGTYDADDAVHAAVRELSAAGSIVIASAGNDNTSKPFYPAAFPEVLAVCSSTRYTERKASYSNYGAWVDLCAPGLQYVSRPLQPGGVASGTSFASPMVAGVLGKLLLEAPCASPSAGRRALLRTAKAVPQSPFQLGAGVLDADAAAQYLRVVYSCERPGSFGQRLLADVRRFAERLGVSLGLIVYFFLSIFTVPLLFAFGLEQMQQRAERRLRQAVLHAYTGSSDSRRARLLVLKQRLARGRKLRRRQRIELFALLHAAQMHGEPCWWCGRVAVAVGEVEEVASRRDGAMVCSRCGLEPDAEC